MLFVVAVNEDGASGIMSKNSSDSDSSCGWTVINHEGCDVEALASENEEPGRSVERSLEESPTLIQRPPAALSAEADPNDASAAAARSCIPPGKPEPAPEGPRGTWPEGAAGEESDIVTLETPKIEEIGRLEEDEIPVSENFHLGSSSSSQYTFCRPEAALPPRPSGGESSSDETSPCSSPTPRRRRAKKRLVSGSEAEEVRPRGPESEPSGKRKFSGGLNGCVILALVIAVSMGFGHFYVQTRKHQLMIKKTHGDEPNDVKDHLLQGQEAGGDCRSLRDGLATCLPPTDMEKDSFEMQSWNLASENQHLRESLGREEKALALLQEELRGLREHIRRLENHKDAGPDPATAEHRKRTARLEEETHRRQSFVQQKKALSAEAQMLWRELDKERQVTEALREELGKWRSQPRSAGAGLQEESRETEALRRRLGELEQKLSFERQRSDLWEKLYVEVKDQAGKRERTEKPEKRGGKEKGKDKKKPNTTFFGSVKETFDAMKNSTKEFVRHHKEKIKQAKEAVKENLRKFSDSVKTTFRQFKDSTKDIFEGREKGRAGDRREAGPKPRPYRAPNGPRESRDGRWAKERCVPRDTAPPECRQKHCAALEDCSGIFDCAQQEPVGLFHRAPDPIRADEFHQLLREYMQREVGHFRHWRDLDVFLGPFFRNGVFARDRMLFADFVKGIKAYLEGMPEYRRDGERAFEDVDAYIYAYYFGQDHSPLDDPSQPPKRAAFTQHGRPCPKHQQRHGREGKRPRQGRPNSRHVADVEIEWGRLPLDAKY